MIDLNASYGGSYPHDLALGVVRVASDVPGATFALEWRKELMVRENMPVPASGPIISLMETACNHAVWEALEGPLSCLTLSLRVDHLRAAQPALRLIAHAQCVRVTKRIVFARGVAHEGDEGDPVAEVSASFFYTTAS